MDYHSRAGLIFAAVISIAASVVLRTEVTSEMQTLERSNGPEDLVCFLRKKPLESCIKSVRGNYSGVPARILHLYSKMSSNLRELIARGSLASAPPQILSDLHPVLFYLIPHGDGRLRAGGEALARYVRARGGETPAIIVSASLLDDVDNRDLFISKLAGVALSERSQLLLGEHLAEWFPGADDWKYDRFGKALKAGNPLVGSLPSPFLTSLPSVTIERFLFLLSQWEAQGTSRGEQWLMKGRAVARTWSLMVQKAQLHLSSWGALSYQRYSFLLLGFTPDELQQMSVPQREVWSSIMQLRFERLQARAVFQVIVGNSTLLEVDNVKSGITAFYLPILPLLSPHQLAMGFNHSVADFGGLNYQSAKRFDGPSFATALQLAHCLITQSMYSKTMNSSHKVNESTNGKTSFNEDAQLSADWSASTSQEHITLESFINAGRFAHTLPISLFNNKNTTRIRPKFLKDFGSDELSLLQGRLLTRNMIVYLGGSSKQPLQHLSSNGSYLVTGDDLMNFGPGLLRALLTTSSIAALNIHRIPQKVIQHLLDVDIEWKFQSKEELSLRSLAILQKIRNELSQPWVLKHVLATRASAQILKYLPPQEIAAISQALVGNSNPITLSSLHETTLSSLLDVAMPELLLRGPGSGRWSSESLTAKPLLRGMRCRHLQLIDAHDVIVVLGQYNRQRMSRGRIKYQPFPKNLQNCAIRAVAAHLEVKASAWNGEKVDFTNPNILQALEASDLESVGGFIIAGLPEQVLEHLGADALRLVGQLSPQELLLALDGKHHPSDISIVLLKQLGMASDMEITAVPVDVFEESHGPKYSVGHLGQRYLELRGQKGSLMPLLFGSLLQFLPSDIVDATSLKWALETANPGGSLVCLGAKQRRSWHSKLVEAFGPPEQWSSSVLGTIGDFLVVVPEESLQRIPKLSWAEAADTLAESTRYFMKNLETPSGFLSYYEVCGTVLSKGEEEMYVNAVKRLARSILVALQWQMDSITPYWRLLGRQSGPSADGIGEIVHVPGLRRPSLSSSAYSHAIVSGKPDRKERESDDLPVHSRSSVTKVSCNAVRAAGPELTALALRPKDIDLMTSWEIGECVEVLGLAQLEADILRMVWAKAKKSELPLDLVSLGRIVSVMSLEDLLSFDATISSNLDAVSVIGREITDWEMVARLVAHVLPPEGVMGMEAVGAMGALLCGVPAAKLPKPQVMFSAAPLVSQSLAWHGRGCPPPQCLSMLANVSSSWLGSPKGNDAWTAMELEFMGILAAGMDAQALKSLADDWSVEKQVAALSGLSTLALDCMPENVLKSLARGEVLQLSHLAATRLSEKHRDLLTEDAQAALGDLSRSPFDLVAFGGGSVAEDDDVTTIPSRACVCSALFLSVASLAAIVSTVL